MDAVDVALIRISKLRHVVERASLLRTTEVFEPSNCLVVEPVEKSGDVGGELRYMGTIANGLLLAGYTPLALGYVDRALKFANEHPETGFPFVVYSTKVLTLLALNQPDEAERFAMAAMTAARAGDRRIKEVELSMMLAQIAEKRGRPEQAIAHLEDAVGTAKAGQVQRLLAEAESDLADAYRARGDLTQALRYAVASVADTTAAGGKTKRIGALPCVLKPRTARRSDDHRSAVPKFPLTEGVRPAQSLRARISPVRHSNVRSTPSLG